MVNKKLAEELRAKGHNYAYIAKELKCSIAWCKLNLKDAPKNVLKDLAIERLTALCKSKGFITKLDLELEISFVLENSSGIRSRSNLTKSILADVRNILNINPKRTKGPVPPYSEHTGKYVVYSVMHGDLLLYIGSGVYGRERHACSGCSHLYELNQMHFNGEVPVVSILKSFSTSEEALMYEQEMIRKNRPKLNRKNAVRFSDDSVVADLQDAS